MIAADRDDEAMVMKVLVPIADDSEDIETACITDVLARAGAEVTTASVMDGRLQVKLARGLKVTADCAIADCVSQKWDAICCPGGMPGAEHLRDSAPLKALLEAQATGGVTAAVCASPAVVLATHGLLKEGKGTCYPAPKFKEAVGAGWADSKVVVAGAADARVITSQGQGTSLQFALAIVEALYGSEVAKKHAAALLTEMP